MWIIIGGAVALYAGFALLDTFKPAREQTRVGFWRLRGVVGFLSYYGVALFAPVFWDGVLAEHTLFDAAQLPLWAQIAGGFLVMELLVYSWHRTLHSNSVLWRAFHQWHHSAERVDIWGAFWFHPMDLIGWAFVGSLALVGIFGVSLPAAISISLASSFCAMFQHSNLRTPMWLRWFLMCPENHSVHHARGVHHYNFGDVPWFDMLFGTYRNPQDAPAEAGFYDGASNRVLPMLVGMDVSKAPQAGRSDGEDDLRGQAAA